MTKQKEWACEHGCDLSAIACEHLEALLPQMGDRRVQRTDVSNASVDFIRIQNPQFSLAQFMELMRNYGFYEEWDLDLLTAKYFHGQSNRQIANDFAYCGKDTVRRRLKTIHALLTERGFEQELR